MAVKWERIIVPIRWQCPFKYQPQMFEHSDVGTISIAIAMPMFEHSNIGVFKHWYMVISLMAMFVQVACIISHSNTGVQTWSSDV